MKTYKRLSFVGFVLLLMAGVAFCVPQAEAAKSLVVGTATGINKTGTDAERTVDLPITLKGGFNDANGLAFTLTYNKSVLEFLSLQQNTTPIDSGASYDPQNPPAASTVAGTIYYQANNKADQGRVLIAAAGANFFSTTTADVVPFKARFRVKLGLGDGTIPIGVTQTLIGPDTALSAGYTVPTLIPVATGLAPTADPATATSFVVTLVGGSIGVTGGYSISGSVQYQGGAAADGAVVKLMKKSGDIFIFNEQKTVSGGQYAFSGKSNGDYKLTVSSTKPGYQTYYESSVITVADANMTVPLITLAAYTAKTGTVTVNGAALAGVKIKVMEGTTVIGSFPVDANGYFVTSPLNPSGTYTFTAVYGNAQQAFNPATPFNWALTLNSIKGTVSGLTTGQQLILHLISETAKLEQAMNITGTGSPLDYEFKNLLPGTDYIVSAAGDGIPVTYYNNVTDFAQASAVTVQAGQDTTNINFTFAATAIEISGRITDGTAGVAAAPVFALETTTLALQSTYADGAGNYTLKLPSGSYTVFTYKASNGKTFYYNSTSTTQLDTQATPVTPPKTGVDINIVEPTCKIEGQVTYGSEGGDPVGGIMVFGQGPKGSAIGVTNQAGTYALTGLTCNDTYAVTIYPDAPYPPQTKSAAATASATLHFVIKVGWVLSGTVAEQGSGTPIPGAWVYLLDSGGKITGMPALTDGQGLFTLADIQTGVYTLVAEHADYQTVEVPNLAIEYDMAGYAVTMTPGVSIAGVVDDGSNPLPNVLVIATAVGEDSRYALTDKVGAYEVGGLVNLKAYFLYFVKPGYLKKLQATTAPQAALNVTLVAPASKVTFSGTVQLQGGGAIQGAVVIIQSASQTYYDAVTTGADGAFSFSGVIASNDYKLTVIPGNGRPVYVDPQALDLSGSVSGRTIIIPSGDISGTVHLSDSATGKTVVVYLVDSATGDWIADITATDAGSGNYTYTFTGIPGSKNFRVCAFSTGYTFGWYGASTFEAATNVQSGASSINFTLNK